MNQIETKRKILTTIVALVLVSIVLMIITIAMVLQDTSAGARPVSAAIGTFVLIILHLVILYGFRTAIRANKQKRPADKGMIIGLGVLLIIFSLVIMDGAFASIERILIVSILLFIVVFCDFLAAIITFTGLFLKQNNKKKDL